LPGTLSLELRRDVLVERLAGAGFNSSRNLVAGRHAQPAYDAVTGGLVAGELLEG
jgi:hypothetical protein